MLFKSNTAHKNRSTIQSNGSLLLYAFNKGEKLDEIGFQPNILGKKK